MAACSDMKRSIKFVFFYCYLSERIPLEFPFSNLATRLSHRVRVCFAVEVYKTEKTYVRAELFSIRGLMNAREILNSFILITRRAQ